MPNVFMQNYTAEQIMDAIASALKDGDMEAVASLMVLLAVKDPESAAVIHDTVKLRAGAHD